jgi:hypothetical protein
MKRKAMKNYYWIVFCEFCEFCVQNRFFHVKQSLDLEPYAQIAPDAAQRSPNH